MKSVFIFIPDIFDYSQARKLRGFVKNHKNTISFYIVTNASSPIIGFCNDNFSQNNVSPIDENQSAQIHMHGKTGQILVNGLNDTYEVTCIMYDYLAFKKCDISTFNCNHYGEYFATLIRAVQNEKSELSTNGHSLSLLIFLFVLNILLKLVNACQRVLEQLLFLLRYSATAIHLHQTVETIKWALKSLRQQQTVTLIVGNILMSKITDFLCGLVMLYFLVQYKAALIQFAYDTIETIVEALEKLLIFLMGAPAGLKLNSAFNLTLGKFYSYHVTLWRAFLDASSPLLSFALYLLVFPGACGLSFQAALLSDLLTFSTFHIYCIYVYAARLYGVQMKGLISLWRLFIGRKYNPLRKRVDSHQYTHNQLFIGTLVFTVLIFLFPTTLLYYAVFATFRITLISMNGFLLRLRYYLQCFPMYTMILWLSNSPSVRGAVKLSLINNVSFETCRIYVSLLTLPFWESIQNTLPETLVAITPVSWNVLFRAIVMGSLI